MISFKNKYLVLLLAVSVAFAQKKGTDVVLKSKYKPLTTYRQSFVQNHTTTITYKGDPEVLSVLKEQGIENPTVQKMNTEFTTETHTGKSLDGKIIPLVITYTKVPESMAQSGIDSTTKIYGHTEADSNPKIDSIVAPKMTEEFKKSLIGAIDGLFTQTKYPPKPFKKGDMQQVVSPITLPIAGMVMEMDIVTDFTLRDVKNGIATFDLGIVYKAKTVDTEHNLSATGTGKGTLSFDTKTQYPLAQQSDITMDMKFTYKEFDVVMSSLMHYGMNYVVIPDKK